MNVAGQSGAYGIDTVSGTMAAGLAAASPVWSLRWGSTTTQLVLLRLAIQMNSLGTGFAAGLGLFEAVKARAFTASDTDGASILPAANNAERRTANATTGVTDLRQSTTATLTAGTRTLDAQPFGAIRAQISTAANTVFLPGVAGNPAVPLFEAANGREPIVLTQDEGLVIRATVPATGTWEFRVLCEWAEATAVH